ncbi:MAG TPA: hypothetical protein VJI46_04930 [Candidatus Nanoarchaeia archaeon]|nr:hypothetical protein [Candidatus Nanoarchaeia archaeon]
MVEKKLIVDELRLSYSGLFEVEEFYKFVDDWIMEHGMEREIKIKHEELAPEGKSIKWEIEIWKNRVEWQRQVIRLRALMSDVQEIIIEKGEGKKRLNQGKVLLIFDTFLESELGGRWQNKPWFYFSRAVFDRFVWKIWTNKYEDLAIKETNELHAAIKSHFNAYAY